MDKIQKLIDGHFLGSENHLEEFRVVGNTYVFTPEQLKSLIKEVAKDCYEEAYKQGYYGDANEFENYWNEHNLTFNED